MRKGRGNIWAWLAAAVLAALSLASGSGERRPGGPDIDGFAALPVLEGGRVKPVDTVARASLLSLRGKSVVRHEGRGIGPAEWLLDLAARPALADTYPVFAVDDPDILGLMRIQQSGERYFSFATLRPFLQEIATQAEEAGKLEAGSRNRFQSAVSRLQEQLTLYQRLENTFQVSGTEDFASELEIYGRAAAEGMAAVERHRKGKNVDEKALRPLAGFLARYRFLDEASYLRPLPPAPGEGPERWRTMGEALADGLKSRWLHPAVSPWARMMTAYRAGDAAAFDAALGTHKRWLAEHGPGPIARAGWELAFNRVDPLYKGMLLYLAALLVVFVSWLRWPGILGRAGRATLASAWVVHTLGLAARMWLQGRPPVTNLYSSAVFVGWMAAGLGLALEALAAGGSLGAPLGGVAASVSAAIGAATLLIAKHLATSGDTMEMMRAVLDSNFWLATHVVTVTIGYSSTFLAGALAHVYILRAALPPGLRADESRALEKMVYGAVCFSLLFSFVGTVLGGIWADQSWGRFWGWDPKENGALLIVLWNAIILHARWGRFVSERGVMVMAVFGNIITSLSWFGVNMLGLGLHSYGFTDKAFVWLAAFVATQLVVMALGAASRPPPPPKHPVQA